MIRSRSEVGVQLYRAARGAGLSLALAEDLLHTAPFLSVENITWIVKCMEHGGEELYRLVYALDCIECGSKITSLGTIGTVFAYARGWQIRDGIKVPGGVLRSMEPIDIPVGIWDRLEFFARRIYVPESARSRAKGAGGDEDD